MADLTIRPHQAVGIDFLADHGRAAIFDEPGLGKSMQALLAMRYLVPRVEDQLLIVATGDALGVWQDEVGTWLDEPHAPGVFAGLKPKPTELDHSVVVTNYARVKDVLPARPWKGVIFDESQALRNRKTATLFGAIRRHFDRSERGLGSIPLAALSGTPIVKAAGDVWPTLHLIDRKTYSAYWKFVNKYAVVWQDQHGWHVEGVTNSNAMWQELSANCLRRTVAEVQPDLPPIVRQKIKLELTPRQRRAYNELDKDWIAAINDSGDLMLAPTVLALETRLRQLLVTPRLLGIDDDGAALKALAEIASNSTYPFVVFTPFPAAFPFIDTALSRAGRPVFELRGGMGTKLAKSVAGFRQSAEAGRAPILLASLQMAKSWSLSRWASRCYMLGFDWNGTTMTQAEDRLHREGQQDTVFAGYLMHPRTLDERSIEIVAGKWRLADAILDRARL